MTLAAGTAGNGLIRQVQKALGEKSQAAQFAPLLYGHNGFDGHDAPAPAWLAGNARTAFEFIAEKPRQEAQAARPLGSRRGRVAREHRRRDPERRHAVPGRLGTWASCRRAGSPCVSSCIPSSRPSATRPATCRRCSARATRTGTTATRKATSPSTFPPLPEAAQRDLAKALSDILVSVRVVVADWQPMLQQVQAAIRHLEAGPPRRAGGRAARVDRLPALAGGRQLHLPGFARIPAFRPAREGRSRAGGQSRPRRAARSRRACAAPRGRAGRHDAGDPPLLCRARAAHHHQGQRDQPGAPPRAHGLRRHQDLSQRRHAGRRNPHRRPLHLAGLCQIAARNPLPAAQGRRRCSSCRAIRRPAMPARR